MKLSRDVANITMDFDAVERLELTADDGADAIFVGDLTGTALKAADIDLSASAGGGDAQPDAVIIRGTSRADRVRVTRAGARVLTTGLPAQTQIAGSEAANDLLLIKTLAGNDDVNVAADVADLIQPSRRPRHRRIATDKGAAATATQRRPPPPPNHPSVPAQANRKTEAFDGSRTHLRARASPQLGHSDRSAHPQSLDMRAAKAEAPPQPAGGTLITVRGRTMPAPGFTEVFRAGLPRSPGATASERESTMVRVAVQWLGGKRVATTASSLAILACVLLAAPASAQQSPDDACPYGWSAEQTVAFSPHGPDSGVLNPVADDGCTLLDDVWNAEPFRTHGDFVRTVGRTALEYRRAGLLTWRGAVRIIAVAARTDVGGKRDRSIDNSCPNRIAVTFDDGPSSYRSQTLAVLRNRQVPATFFDLGMRVDANPHIARFEAAEAHLVLNHTYSHPDLSAISLDSIRRQILETEAALARAGAPMPFRLLRPPFGSSDADVEAVAAELGYAINGPLFGPGGVILSLDWLPTTTAAEIRDTIVSGLRPGAAILMHDGPVDSPVGAAVIEALPQIIDAARQRGYCFGVLDVQSRVVAARHVPTHRRIPSVVSPVPYLPLIPEAAGLTPPDPYVVVNHPF